MLIIYSIQNPLGQVGVQILIAESKLYLALSFTIVFLYEDL